MKSRLIQILVAVFFFMTVIPLTITAIYGFSKAGINDPITQILVQTWMYLIIPITIYIAVFTKFDNPFRRKKNADANN